MKEGHGQIKQALEHNFKLITNAKKSPNCKHVLTFGIMYVFLPMTAIYTITCVKLQHGVPGFKHVIYSTTLYPHAVPGKILGKLLGKLLVKHKICVFAGRMIMHKL